MATRMNRVTKKQLSPGLIQWNNKYSEDTIKKDLKRRKDPKCFIVYLSPLIQIGKYNVNKIIKKNKQNLV